MSPISRRKFLAGAFMTGGFALLTPSRNLHASLFGLLSRSPGAGRDTTPLTKNEDFYITTLDVTPQIQLDRWSLSVHGMVERPGMFGYEDLQTFPQRAMVATLECIGNPVGGESIGTAEWEGVPLHLLLEGVGVNPAGVDLIMRARDGYSDSLSLSRAQESDVLLAIKMNGEPLPADHGFPARIIVPGLYGLKHVKWLTDLEVVDYDYKGHWQQEGWPEDASIKPMSRIDQPGDGQLITDRSFTVRGIAFCGRSGVEMIEVSTNAGKTWQAATLEPRLSPYSWVIWNHEWQIPNSGEHVIMVRTTDGEGKTQSSKPGDLHAVTVETSVKR